MGYNLRLSITSVVTTVLLILHCIRLIIYQNINSNIGTHTTKVIANRERHRIYQEIVKVWEVSNDSKGQYCFERKEGSRSFLKHQERVRCEELA